jgi:hypothetical protein
MQDLRTSVEKILGCDLAISIGINDEIEAEKRIGKFLSALEN